MKDIPATPTVHIYAGMIRFSTRNLGTRYIKAWPPKKLQKKTRNVTVVRKMVASPLTFDPKKRAKSNAIRKFEIVDSSRKNVVFVMPCCKNYN